jgi:hypothetical protein
MLFSFKSPKIVVVPVIDPIVVRPRNVVRLFSVVVAASRASNARESVVVDQSEVKYPPLIEMAFVERSGKVEVAVVEVAVKYSPTTCPTTDNFAYGEVVPTPTLFSK